jgi:2-iminoacetate synthase
MEFSVPGFIKRFCTPNAILTLTEYIIDYAKDDTAIKAWKLIEKNIGELNEPKLEASVREKVDRIKNGERDIYY